MPKKFMTNAEIVQKAEAEIAGDLYQIRGDRSRTEAYKRAEVAKAYQRMRATRDRLVAERDAARADYRRTLERDVFAGQGSSDPSWAISRRDAADRADQVESEAQAMQLLARAERQGDEPLARAIAEKAYEYSWADVGNQFLQARPNLAPRFQELWEYREPTAQEAFHEAIALQARPEELGTMADHEVDQLAASFDAEQQAQAAAPPTQAQLNQQMAGHIRMAEGRIA